MKKVKPRVTRRLMEIDLSLIDRDPGQPRQDFDEESIIELAVSIQEQTLLQVPLVKANPAAAGRFLIVAGERRFRAMQLAGIQKDIFVLLEGDLDKSYILSAIENCHRKDLNPIEAATTFKRLHDEEGLTWEEVHDLLGQSVPVILNKVKLLDLPEEIQQMIRKGEMPQVSALNLAQFRNSEKGALIRMAYDLIAGQAPMDLVVRNETAHSERLVQAHLPHDAEAFMRRILRLTGRVYSMPAVLEGFLKLPKGERLQAWSLVNPTTRGKFRLKLSALIRSLQAFREMMDLPLQEPLVIAPQTEAAMPAEERPVPAPTSAPVTPVRRTEEKPVRENRRLRRARIAATSSVHGGNGNGEPRSFAVNLQPPDGNQSLGTTLLALRMMFEGERVNLGRRFLSRALQVNGGEEQKVAVNALRVLRDNWKEPLPADRKSDKARLILFVSKLRSDCGSPTFAEFLDIARRDDDSADPVDLGLV